VVYSFEGDIFHTQHILILCPFHALYIATLGPILKSQLS
jgi:hypothetical protein